MERFSKQILLDGVGKQGQDKISSVKLLIVGLGGISAPLVRYLASSGINNFDIIDDDVVETHNLPRQNNFYIEDVDKLKSEVTHELILKLNPDANVTSFSKRLDKKFLSERIEKYDYIIDGSDNFKTKFICNDLSHNNNKIFVSGSFAGYKGYLSIYKSGIDITKPCFRCFHPEYIDDRNSRACYNQGVLSAGVGTVGTFMAAEIFKDIAGVGADIAGKMMVFDFLKNNHRIIRLSKNKTCKCNT